MVKNYFKCFIVSILLLGHTFALLAENRTVRPDEIKKFDNLNIEHTLNNLIGEQIKLDFTDCSERFLSLYLYYLNKDTTWIKPISNPKKAKLNKHYTVQDIPITKEDIESRTYLVTKTENRIVGQYQTTSYSDVYLQDIANPNSVLVWKVQTSSNYQTVNNPEVRVLIDKYQKIVTDRYVDNEDYYILDDENCNPNKDNGYLHYVPVKCVGCTWYLGGRYLSPIYISTYETADGKQYKYDEYRITINKLPIYKTDYLERVEQTINRLKEEGSYYYTMAKVTKPKNSAIRYGKTTEIKSDDIVSKYLYEDNIMSILWLILDDRCQFTIKNKSGNSIKIIWDDASFVDENNSASKVYHSGIRYIDANKPQPSTSIPNGTELEDLVAPTSRLYYYDGWGSASLINHKNRYDAELVGKTIRINLPIEVKGVINEYEFTFRANWRYAHPEYHQVDK